MGKYNREYTTPLSNKYNLPLEARHKANTRSTSQMRDRHKANNNNNHLTLEGFQLNLHISLEGYKHHFHNHLSLEGYHNEWKVITLGGLSQRQTDSFLQNKILIDRIDDKLKCEKIKCFE